MYGQNQRMSFADAESQQDFSDMIPNGTLAFGQLRLKWYNADQGIVETPSKTSEARYLDCEVTIIANPANGAPHKYQKRKVFTRIGVAGSEKYVNMGRSAIKAILETGKGASQQNPTGYEIGSYADLDDLIVAVKVKEEPAKDGYAAKNDIAVWLSPVDSVTAKDFQRLMTNDTEPKGRAAGAKPAQQAGPAWAAGATPSPTATAATPAASQPASAPAQQGNPLAKPAFLGGSTAPQAQPNAPAAGPAWTRS